MQDFKYNKIKVDNEISCERVNTIKKQEEKKTMLSTTHGIFFYHLLFPSLCNESSITSIKKHIQHFSPIVFVKTFINFRDAFFFMSSIQRKFAGLVIFFYFKIKLKYA